MEQPSRKQENQLTKAEAAKEYLLGYITRLANRGEITESQKSQAGAQLELLRTAAEGNEEIREVYERMQMAYDGAIARYQNSKMIDSTPKDEWPNLVQDIEKPNDEE